MFGWFKGKKRKRDIKRKETVSNTDILKRLNEIDANVLEVPKLVMRAKNLMSVSIDKGIVNIINRAGEISSKDLIITARDLEVCSKNTLYSHLRELLNQGFIIKLVRGKKVYYSIPTFLNERQNGKR